MKDRERTRIKGKRKGEIRRTMQNYQQEISPNYYYHKKIITRIKYEHAKVHNTFFSLPRHLNVRPCETCNRKVIGGEECFNGATERGEKPSCHKTE